MLKIAAIFYSISIIIFAIGYRFYRHRKQKKHHQDNL